MPTAILQCRAAPAIGGGHVMRCLALADALTRGGWNCKFIVNEAARVTVPSLSRYQAADLDRTGRLRQDSSDADEKGFGHLLVVDDYELDQKHEQTCRSWASTVAVIDDLANRSHDCDILIDQNLGRTAADYAELVPADCHILVSPSVALLRSDFAEARPRSIARRLPARAEHIVVSFGAGAISSVVDRLLPLLAARLPHCRFDVIGGQSPACGPSIDPNPRFCFHRFVADMAGLLTVADLVVGAAGVSAWERCVLGVPSAVIAIANNQTENAKQLADKGAALFLGLWPNLDVEQAVDQIVALANSPERLVQQSQAAQVICDGQGAFRAAAALTDLFEQRAWRRLLAVAKGRNDIDLRFATHDDTALLFRWQTEAGARTFSRSSEVPSFDQHERWVADSLAEPRRLLFIILLDGTPIGSLRLDRNSQGFSYEISILLTGAARGRGAGTKTLSLLPKLRPDCTFAGYVLRENSASRAAFLRAGYVERIENVFIAGLASA